MREIKASMKYVIFLSLFLISGCLPKGSADRNDYQKYGFLKIYTDKLTMCQYISTSSYGGGITPRVDGKGRHLGCDEN